MQLRSALRESIPQLPLPTPSQSAVIVAIDPFSQEEPSLVLTKRTLTVESHKGQISFPGGYFEPGDTDLKQTALREFEEELGAPRESLDTWGCLETVYTHVNVPIIPWVGLINYKLVFKPNFSEVDRIIFLPLHRLILEGLNPVTAWTGSKNVQSQGIRVDGELVWGATARILMSLKSHLEL